MDDARSFSAITKGRLRRGHSSEECRRWIIENGPTTVVYSDTLLRDIQEIMGKR